MKINNNIRVFRNLSRVTGRSVIYELVRRAASKIYGIESTQNYLLYGFFHKNFSRWKHYLTNNEKRVLQFLAIPPDSLALTTNKANFAMRCFELNIPVPTTKCLYSRESQSASPGVDVFQDEEKLATHIQSFCDGFYIMKPITGRHGDGIVKFEVCNGNLVDKSGGATTASQLIEDSSSNPYGDSGLIVQEFIRPHEDLLPIMKGPGLGTIRFMTPSATKW